MTRFLALTTRSLGGKRIDERLPRGSALLMLLLLLLLLLSLFQLHTKRVSFSAGDGSSVAVYKLQLAPML